MIWVEGGVFYRVGNVGGGFSLRVGGGRCGVGFRYFDFVGFLVGVETCCLSGEGFRVGKSCGEILWIRVIRLGDK